MNAAIRIAPPTPHASGESFANARAESLVAQIAKSLATVLPRDVVEERARNVVSGVLLAMWDAFDAGWAQGMRDEDANRCDLGGEG